MGFLDSKNDVNKTLFSEEELKNHTKYFPEFEKLDIDIEDLMDDIPTDEDLMRPTEQQNTELINNIERIGRLIPMNRRI
jgi:hypothetical protein